MSKKEKQPQPRSKPTPNDVLSFQQHLMHKEELLRDKYREQQRQDQQRPPPEVDALVNRIRRAVEIYINRNGGSVPSILRRLFLKYDHQVAGLLGPSEMAYVLNYLKCPASRSELESLVKYYAVGKNSMGYEGLVKDVLKGMRHYLQFPTTRSNPDIYSPGSNPAAYKPKERVALINTFVRKLKGVLLRRVIRGGSTERTELDKLFFKYGDKGVLDFQAFKSAINALGMKISQLEAEQVYQHFAEEDCGGIKNQSFINDVLSDITHWSKMPTEDQLKTLRLGPAADWAPSIDSYRSDLYKFTSRPIRRPANMTVEKFKQKLKYVCDQKIIKSGDLMYWVLLRAFVLWDSATSATRGRLDLKHFKGALKKLNCPCTDDEALEVIRYYDMDGSGMISYKELIKDTCKLDRGWMTYNEGIMETITDFSARVQLPPIIKKIQSQILQASQNWATHFSSNVPQSGISPRDAFHGICLRFDSTNQGRLTTSDFKKVLKELKLHLDEKEERRVLHWYSIGGGSHVDYQRILKDLFPCIISNDERKKNNDNNQTSSALALTAVMPKMTIRQAEKLARDKLAQKRRLKTG